MLRLINEADAKNICGGDNNSPPHVSTALEHPSTTQGKSPTGTKPTNNTGTGSNTSSATHS